MSEAQVETSVSAAPADDVALVKELATAKGKVLGEIQKRIVGQQDVIELLLVSLFAQGHGLFVGVPGLAKTLLIQSLAQALDLQSQRIQFTPDLMPSDITGTDVLEEDPETGKRRFRFIPGPVFTNILADEINRTPPKTQAALLQAMAEGQVTAGGRTHRLEAPYLVFATQNPIEQEGTYPLPEAQLDRFLLQLDVDYPDEDEELEIVRRTTAPLGPGPQPVLDQQTIVQLQNLIPRIPAADHVLRYAVNLVRASRPKDKAGQPNPNAPASIRDYLSFGAGPRASQALIVGAKARAALDGRFAAEIEDIQALAAPTLRHRLVPNFRANAEGVSTPQLIEGLVASIAP